MDVEIQNFIQTWLAAIACICYCYYLVSNLPKGITRLFFLLPVFYLFTTIPLRLSSFHLAGPTVFYLFWLSNFKLLLLAFGKPPLQSHPPLRFVAIALFPIKTISKESKPIRQHPFVKSHKIAILAVKVLLLSLIVSLYSYRDHLHPHLILALYCCHLYLGIELVLIMTASPVQAIFGLEIEPQFNEPYLCSSLQDFWGRRWNLMVSNILRPTVYNPVKSATAKVMGRRGSAAVAMIAAFLVSGLMHEAIYYYLTRVPPTWEVTWFFVFHGLCTALEVAVKRVVGRKWRVPWWVSGPVTLTFVGVTGAWWFFPQIIRNGVDRKAINEYSILARFVTNAF